MKYTSTRDSSKLYTFEEAILSGYAQDGGLFVPETLPQINHETLNEWSKFSYVDLSTQVLLPFLQEDIPETDLHDLLCQALSGFDTKDDIVPVLPMIRKKQQAASNNQNSIRAYVAELYHGPTFCFKDLGMRVTIFLLNYFATRRNQKVILVVSTTGDTGPAAVQAVQDLNSSYLSILVHYPKEQISDFQRKQLTTVQSSQVEIVTFEGGGDDMDIPIKNIMTQRKDDDGDVDDNVICGVNSYNIGRPLMQMIHFIWTYLRIVGDLQQTKRNQKIKLDDFRLDIVIPTGAMGNIAGCYMAKKMGVPLGILCAGVNVNDITNTTIQTGIVQKATTSDESMKKTLSDAINIQLPYNLERLLFYLTNENHEQIKMWYNQLEKGPNHCMKINQSTWFTKLQSEFSSARITDDEMCQTMQYILEEYDYWSDPHTSIAFAAGIKLGYLPFTLSADNVSKRRAESSNVVAFMATAAPCKFQQSMTISLGQEKWDEYERKHFPSRGIELLEKEEKSPIVYKAESGKTLEENQIVWEAKTRELIKQLGVLREHPLT